MSQLANLTGSGLTLGPNLTSTQLSSHTNIARKMALVMAEAGWIEKGSQVKMGGKVAYDYVSEAQFIAELRPLFVKHKLVVAPVKTEIVSIDKTEKAGNDGKVSVSYLTTINVTYNIYDVDSGEILSIAMPGQGIDSGDKGIYKALTGAFKNMLRQGFMIGTGVDPEGTDENGTVVGEEKEDYDANEERKKRERRERVVNTWKRIKELCANNNIEMTKYAELFTEYGIDLNNYPKRLSKLEAMYDFFNNLVRGISESETTKMFREKMQKADD